MNLQEWLSTCTAELGLDDVEVSEETTRVLLDVARDAAHEVERVAAPLTTYLLGVAVGRGATLGRAAAQTTDRLQADGSASAEK